MRHCIRGPQHQEAEKSLSERVRAVVPASAAVTVNSVTYTNSLESHLPCFLYVKGFS